MLSVELDEEGVVLSIELDEEVVLSVGAGSSGFLVALLCRRRSLLVFCFPSRFCNSCLIGSTSVVLVCRARSLSFGQWNQ